MMHPHEHVPWMGKEDTPHSHLARFEQQTHGESDHIHPHLRDEGSRQRSQCVLSAGWPGEARTCACFGNGEIMTPCPRHGGRGSLTPALPKGLPPALNPVFPHQRSFILRRSSV